MKTVYFLACTLAGVMACGTESTPALARIVTGIVTDSLGTPIRHIGVLAVVWQGNDSVAGGQALSDGAGVYAMLWETPPPDEYDSLVLVTTHGSGLLTSSICRPYSTVRLVRAANQLTGFPDDSVHLPISLGLAFMPPAIIAGTARCAIGHEPFGEFTSSFLLQLIIERLGPSPGPEAISGDSVSGRWEIAFQETRYTLEGAFAGVLAGDTLDLTLGVEPPVYTDCAPGYRLRVALDGARRMGDGFLEALNPTVPQCPVEPLEPLRFVPL